MRRPERNCARTPMQWSAERQAGFTASEKPVSPLITGGAYGFEHINVATQRRNPDSMLNWTERLLRMRKEVPEIGWGQFDVVKTSEKAILAIRHTWRNNSVLMMHNLSELPLQVEFIPGAEGSYASFLVNLLSDDHSKPDDDHRHKVLFEPYGYRWFRIGGMDYLLRINPSSS